MPYSICMCSSEAARVVSCHPRFADCRFPCAGVIIFSMNCVSTRLLQLWVDGRQCGSNPGVRRRLALALRTAFG
jgi:hypothetical protein